MALTQRALSGHRVPRPDVVVVFGLALVVRLLLVVTSPGGFTGSYGYDASVYYTSADELTFGRMPYADYLLLHPPGLTLVLTPFALLGRLTTDHAGFIAANLAFTALGAVNAVLIVLVARRLGLCRWAALAGGCFYAVWLSAAGPEISARLEPLGTVAFLVALLLSSRPRPSGRVLVAAGAALGFAATVKIWWIVPLLVLIAWHAVIARDRRVAGLMLAGAAGTMALVLGPFFAAAPGRMWRMIVTDQLGRHSTRAFAGRRIFELSSLDQFASRHATKPVAAVVVVVAVLLLAGAWQHRPARPVVVVVAAQCAVLLASPTYFAYYSGYVASGAALLVAAAAEPRAAAAGLRAITRAGLPAVTGVVAAAVTAAALVTGPASDAVPVPLHVGPLAASVRHVRCVMSDSPMALIALDALSRGLADGCRNWGDVSGRTYDVDVSRRVRTANRRWQADILRYLQSGQAAIVIRKDTGLDAASRRRIDDLPVLARYGGLTVYRTPR